MTKDSEHKIKFNQDDYEILKREVIYEGRYRYVIYHIRYRLYNGGWSETVTREVMERSSAAAVLPYDPYLDRVVLIEQFRPGAIAHPTNPWTTEIVAGVIEHNETPDEVAMREAEEEAGCTIKALYPVQEFFVSPSCSTEYMTIYCGKVDASNIGGIHGLSAESENIRAYSLPAEEAFEKLRTGHINTAPAIVALHWLHLNRHLLQALWVEPLETK